MKAGRREVFWVSETAGLRRDGKTPQREPQCSRSLKNFPPPPFMFPTLDLNPCSGESKDACGRKERRLRHWSACSRWLRLERDVHARRIPALDCHSACDRDVAVRLERQHAIARMHALQP